MKQVQVMCAGCRAQLMFRVQEMCGVMKQVQVMCALCRVQLMFRVQVMCGVRVMCRYILLGH